MLPKQYRASTKDFLNISGSHSKVRPDFFVSTPLLGLSVYKTETTKPLFAARVGKKVASLATVRNKFRRCIYQSVSEHDKNYQDFPSGLYVLSVKGSVKGFTKIQLSKRVNDLKGDVSNLLTQTQESFN